MTPAEAMTRPDAWVVIPWGSRFRVGRVVDSSGSIAWHRGRRRLVASLYGAIITFTIAAHAEARAGALNLADAEASR